MSKQDTAFLKEQIITYLGKKRNLLVFIGKALRRSGICKDRLCIFDVFSGSGVVSRYFKCFAERLYVNVQLCRQRVLAFQQEPR